MYVQCPEALLSPSPHGVWNPLKEVPDQRCSQWFQAIGEIRKLQGEEGRYHPETIVGDTTPGV